MTNSAAPRDISREIEQLRVTLDGLFNLIQDRVAIPQPTVTTINPIGTQRIEHMPIGINIESDEEISVPTVRRIVTRASSQREILSDFDEDECQMETGDVNDSSNTDEHTMSILNARYNRSGVVEVLVRWNESNEEEWINRDQIYGNQTNDRMISNMLSDWWHLVQENNDLCDGVNVIIYIRRSTKSTTQCEYDVSDSIEQQLENCLSYCSSNNFRVADVLIHNGVTGRLGNNLNHASMYDFVDDHDYTYFIVDNIDRIGRHVESAVSFVTDLRENYGVEVISAKEPLINISGLSDEFLEKIRAAQAYTDDRSESSKASHKNRLFRRQDEFIEKFTPSQMIGKRLQFKSSNTNNKYVNGVVKRYNPTKMKLLVEFRDAKNRKMKDTLIVPSCDTSIKTFM